MGQLGGSSSFDFIDNLTYAYTGNQLKYVNDQPGVNYSDNGFTDNGSFLTTNEYFYDLNGNLTQDMNKQIDHIGYNHLNLPQHIAIGTSAFNIIDYIYTADGVKRQKSIAGSGARSAPTDYLGSIVYPGDADAFIFTSEGRALRNDQGKFDYEYFLKDHLGNTRVSFNQKGTILQDNSYYPFGMSLGESLTYVDNTAIENKYLYNGKEMQDDFGLGWYDYGARMYDAQLGRWHVVDPLAEYHFNFTPYNYCLNNPINFIDPLGLDTTYIAPDLPEVEIIEQKSDNPNKGGYYFEWKMAVGIPDHTEGDADSRNMDGLIPFSGVKLSQYLSILNFFRDMLKFFDEPDIESLDEKPEPTKDEEILKSSGGILPHEKSPIEKAWKRGQQLGAPDMLIQSDVGVVTRQDSCGETFTSQETDTVDMYIGIRSNGNRGLHKIKFSEIRNK